MPSIGNDTSVGGPDDDYLLGTEGDDTFAGGAGDDTVDFARSDAPVTADLTAGTAVGQGSDSLVQVETLNGTRFADVFTGDGADINLSGGRAIDQLFGLGGSDVLDGGERTDALDGGAGDDTASYATSRNPITADLEAGFAIGDGSDTLIAIEDIQGSPLSDLLRGDSGPNSLAGGEGDDQLEGREGNDTLNGAEGTDNADGGGGTDACTAESVINCEP